MRKKIIKGGLLIDGCGGEPIQNTGILVENQLIQWVGDDLQQTLKSCDDVEVIEAEGLTILPGLIDCHVHLTFDPTPDFMGQSNDSLTLSTIKAIRNAQRSIEAGVTTIRDLGAKSNIVIDLSKAIQEGFLDGPRIIAAGKIITMTGGHGYFIGREADGLEEVRKAVREQIKDGAGVIKTVATGGVGTVGSHPGSPQYTEEELREIVKEAHKSGLLIACHAIGNEGIKNALRVGIDSIEHGTFLDEEAIELFKRKKAFLVPTLTVDFQWARYGLELGIDKYFLEKAMPQFEALQSSCSRAISAGVRIATGTDAGCPATNHGSVAKEVGFLVQCGLTSMKAILAATQVASEVVGLSDKIGTIEKGKLADIILVDGNPLEDISALEKVKLIMKDGKVIKSMEMMAYRSV